MKQRGFSLIEMIISILILAVLGTTAGYGLTGGARAFSDNTDVLQTLGKLRYASERMAREVREIRRDTANPENFDITSMTATSLSFTRGNGTVVTLTASPPLLELAYSFPAGAQTLTDEVGSMSFAYLQSDGSTTATSIADVAFIEFNLTLSSAGKKLSTTYPRCTAQSTMNSGNLKQQQGAVTLIGAMFLIVSVVILLVAAQRMAGSSITDSALHRDGIQALFIAESGLEQATWRYSEGYACTALDGESGNIGRGSFTIVAASLVGTFCRVRVMGSVTTTISENTVVRIIEGDLTGSSSSSTDDSGVWAVGERDNYGELLLNYDGNRWSWPLPNTDILNRNFYGVSCVAANDCWAVGDTYNGEMIIHWDGSNWNRVGPYTGIPNRSLYDVHCVANNDCWAVGQDDNGELIIHWDGSNWNRVGPYGGIPNESLRGVYCVTSNDCWAVGEDGNGELIIHWDGSSWSRSGPYGGIPNENLHSVHCVASNDCWAVGDDDSGELIIHWDGSSWNRFGPYSAISNQSLYSVHCANTNHCWAVGERAGYEQIIHWNGTTWSRMRNSSSIANIHLYAVHMVSED